MLCGWGVRREGGGGCDTHTTMHISRHTYTTYRHKGPAQQLTCTYAPYPTAAAAAAETAEAAAAVEAVDSIPPSSSSSFSLAVSGTGEGRVCVSLDLCALVCERVPVQINPNPTMRRLYLHTYT